MGADPSIINIREYVVGRLEVQPAGKPTGILDEIVLFALVLHRMLPMTQDTL